MLFHLFLAMAPQEQVIAQEQPKLLLYYNPNCPFCKHVLQYLTSIKKQIPMCNVTNDRTCLNNLITKGGLPQVPCLTVDEKPIYDDQRIITWLNTHRDLLKDL